MNTGFPEKSKERKGCKCVHPSKQKEDLLPVVAAHAEDLDHADENVDEVELEADTLVDDIALHVTPLGKASVVQDFLDIVESEATKDSKTTVQPDAL